MKHELLLELGDFLPGLREELLHDGPHDTESKLKFDVAELADRMGRGEATIPLAEIHRRAPEIFRAEIHRSDQTVVRFPWQKVAQLLVSARTGSGTEGFTLAAAEFFAERLRAHQAARTVRPGRVESGRIPSPGASFAQAVRAGRARPGDTPTAEIPAASRIPAPAGHGRPEGALTVSVKSAGTPPPDDDESLSREELLRARKALRAQLARTKNEFTRQLAAAWEERQRIALERERFVAEMVRARVVADDRVEQIAFERSVVAKTAENLAKAQEDAWAIERELAAFHAEAAKAHEETDHFIDELIAERDALAQGQPLAPHQLAALEKRRQVGLALRERAAPVGGAPRAAKEGPRPIDAPKRPPAAGKSDQREVAEIEETPGAKRCGRAPAARQTVGMLVFSALLGGVFAIWYLQLSKDDGALTAEARQLDRESAAVSASLDETRMVRSRLQSLIDGARGARDEFERDDRWTPALRSIVASANEGIELRAIQVVKSPGDLRAGGLRIQGFAMGIAPRATADRFFQTLQRELRQRFPVAEPCRFEQLEDEPELRSTGPDQRRATFTITAPFGAAVAPKRASSPKPEA